MAFYFEADDATMNPLPTLLIRHPEMAPQTITDTLGLPPNTTFPPRHDYQTFWAHHFALRNDGDLPGFFMSAIEVLRQHHSFLKNIRASGGTVQFVIDVVEHGTELRVEVRHDLLSTLGDLGIDIDFTLYDHKADGVPSA